MTREQVVGISLTGSIFGIIVYVVADVLHRTTVAWSGLVLHIISTSVLGVAVVVGLVDYIEQGRRGE